jgi:hypothetical protein
MFSRLGCDAVWIVLGSDRLDVSRTASTGRARVVIRVAERSLYGLAVYLHQAVGDAGRLIEVRNADLGGHLLV